MSHQARIVGQQWCISSAWDKFMAQQWRIFFTYKCSVGIGWDMWVKSGASFLIYNGSVVNKGAWGKVCGVNSGALVLLGLTHKCCVEIGWDMFVGQKWGHFF